MARHQKLVSNSEGERGFYLLICIKRLEAELRNVWLRTPPLLLPGDSPHADAEFLFPCDHGQTVAIGRKKFTATV